MPRSRWGMSGLAAALLAVGCASESEGPRLPPRAESADEPADEPEEGAAGPEASSEIAGVDSEVVRPEVDLGSLDVVNHRLPMIAVGEVLLARSRVDAEIERQVPDLVVSTDHGETWERVQMPGSADAPVRGHSVSLSLAGEVAIVTADFLDPRSESRYYAWTSIDGVSWRGGRLTEDLGGVVGIGMPSSWQLPGGELVVPFDFSIESPAQVLQSDDGGDSWQVVDCPPESSIVLGGLGGCFALRGAGDLLVRAGEVSFDAGVKWERPVFAPEVADVADFPHVDDVAELAGGGWVAAGSVDLDDCGFGPLGSRCAGLLARSDDGRRWERLFESDPCWKAEEGVAEPSSLFSTPVPFGDRWLVVYTCFDSLTPEWSEMYLLDADGSDPATVANTRQAGTSYDQPLAVGGLVVVPEISAGGDTATLIQLRP
jgi:hypothetical protein